MSLLAGLFIYLWFEGIRYNRQLLFLETGYHSRGAKVDKVDVDVDVCVCVSVYR